MSFRTRRRLTPGVRRAIRRAIEDHRGDLLVVGLATLVLGVMPTAKSAFEATIVSQIDRELSDGSGMERLGEAVTHVWQAEVEPTSSSDEGGVDAFIAETVGEVTSDGRLGWVLVAYVVIAGHGCLDGRRPAARRRARVTQAGIGLRSDAITVA